MRKILLVIPLALIVIGGLVAYKLTRPPPTVAFPTPEALLAARPAPLFQLYDQHSQIVRLAGFLGRHKIVIAFFDGTHGLDESELLRRLRDGFPKIYETKAKLFAISALRPAEHRQGAEREASFPFPMLSDLDYYVHRQWGAYNPDREQPREAVFIVDRGGVVRHVHLGPDNLGTADEWVEEILKSP